MRIAAARRAEREREREIESERERGTGSILYGAEPSGSIADFKPSGLAVAWTTRFCGPRASPSSRKEARREYTPTPIKHSIGTVYLCNHTDAHTVRERGGEGGGGGEEREWERGGERECGRV